MQYNIELGRAFASKVVEVFRKAAYLDKFTPPPCIRSLEERARYLFYFISIDYGMKAEKLFERARKVYCENKGLFNPKVMAQIEDEQLSEIISRLKLRFPNQAKERWKRNSRVLLERYHGKVLQVFEGSADDIVQRLKGFYGFGEKLSRLLLRVMVDWKVIEKPEGFEKMAPPTDIHLVKLAYRCGMIDEEPSYNKHVNIIRNLWKKATPKGISPMEVDRALWWLGSHFCASRKCETCPVKCKRPLKST